MIETITGFILLCCAFLIVALGVPGLLIVIPIVGALLAAVVVLCGLADHLWQRMRGA